MNNPFVLLGVFIFFSFAYLDNVLKHWKREEDEKLDDLKLAIDDLQSNFDEKFGKSENDSDLDRNI